MLTVKENITNALTWFYKKIKLNYLDVIREKLDEFITGHADVFLMDDEGNVYMDEDDTGYVYSWDSSVFARRDTVSDVFDRDKNYSAGDYCIYNNTLYKFIADKEKGIWDDDAVEAVNVTDELKEKEEEITQNTSLINTKQDQLTDSGWITLSLESTATAYNSSSTPVYRKIGNLVHIVGAVVPTSSGTGSTTNIQFATLPSGYRPPKNECILCQGSGVCKWVLTISSAGAVSFGRYSDNSGYASYSSNTWLPFSATFIVS